MDTSDTSKPVGGALEGASVDGVELIVGDRPEGDAGDASGGASDSKVQVAAAAGILSAMSAARKDDTGSRDHVAEGGAKAEEPTSTGAATRPGDAALAAAVPTARRLLLDACVAELIGTFFIVIFGTGVVTAATVLEAQVGLWQIAAVWGWGVALAIFTTGEVSGAHLNPAISLAFALLRPRDFPARKLLPYVTAQMLGGILG